MTGKMMPWRNEEISLTPVCVCVFATHSRRYKDSWKYKQCESFLSEDMELPFMHMDDCLRAAMELIMAPKRMLSRPCYNITAFSATPKQVFESIKKFIPECTVEYNADERDLIARSWPNSIDDSVARQDWEWRHTHDLDKVR